MPTTLPAAVVFPDLWIQRDSFAAFHCACCARVLLSTAFRAHLFRFTCPPRTDATLPPLLLHPPAVRGLCTASIPTLLRRPPSHFKKKNQQRCVFVDPRTQKHTCNSPPKVTSSSAAFEQKIALEPKWLRRANEPIKISALVMCTRHKQHRKRMSARHSRSAILHAAQPAPQRRLLGSSDGTAGLGEECNSSMARTPWLSVATRSRWSGEAPGAVTNISQKSSATWSNDTCQKDCHS